MSTTFTVEEINLICIFPRATKPILMKAILAAQRWMVDAELTALSRNTLYKLSKLTEDEFQCMQLVPVYDDTENVEIGDL